HFSAMSGLIRRIRRTNKKAAKYSFTATLQELHLTAKDPAVHPKAVVVSFQHRRRITSSKEREWETSFSNPSQTVIVWPELTPDTIEVLTTLYKGPNDEAFEDKEWTIVVDEITAKNRRRPIAAVPLNMRLFIHDHPGSRSQLKLKLRPLSPQIEHASILLTLAASLITDGFRDDMSLTSSCSGRATREASVVDGVGTEEGDGRPVDAKAVAEIARISDEMAKNFGEKGEEKRKEEEERERKESDSKVRPPWRMTSPTGEKEKEKEKKREKKEQEEKERPNPVQEQLAKLPTHAFFEVDADSVPHQVLAPPNTLVTSISMRRGSPRASTRERERRERTGPPEKIEGEDVMAWCKRVTKDYSLQQPEVNDFRKSFSNGLALCALIHAYRPELIGEFANLDISNTSTGKKKNVLVALAAAATLGVQPSSLPDDSDITTPDPKQIKLLVERLRRLLEGSTELPTPLSMSDHRISKMFGVSEDERGVIASLKTLQDEAEAFQSPAYRGVTEEDREMAVRTLEREKKEKKQRSALSYDTYASPVDSASTVPPTVPSQDTVVSRDSVVMTSPSASREAHDPFASSSSEEKEERREDQPSSNGAEKDVEEVDGKTRKTGDLRDMTMLTPTLARKFSAGTGRSTTLTSKEEYRQKARAMLNDPQTALASFSTPPSGAAEERRREEARNIIENAQADGATFVIHSNPHHHHQRAGSSSGGNMTSSTIVQSSTLRKFPSRTSLGGSATDLRRVELVAPSPVQIHKFKKRDPSPALSRKIYDNGETPHVPAISASREDVSSRVVNVVTSFRRHGSMRADELKDLVYNYAQQFNAAPAQSSLAAPPSDPRSATLPATPSTQRSRDVMATPTRKVTAQWEKDVDDEERTTREQETIAEELLRITGEIRAREAVIREAGLVPGGEEETKLMEDLHRMAREKNGLVVKQDYYNVIENLREAINRFNGLKAELDTVSAEQDYCKTEEEKQRRDDLMAKYMAAVESRNVLTQELMAAEEKLLEGDDYDDFSTPGGNNTNSLGRGATMGSNGAFQRGAPVSASRRIAQGVKNWLQGPP
ncbi:ehbp-1, partial [Pristionchus pacificus]